MLHCKNKPIVRRIPLPCRAQELSLTDDIREWAILSARMAMREGVLHEKYWPMEPHLAAFARARECHVRVWNEGQSVGHEWLHYGDVGQCVSIRYNGTDHYDALVRHVEQSHWSDVAEAHVPGHN
eukprot:5245694-Amphidinium_carterae.1